MSTSKIQTTRNYALFTISTENREIEINKRGDLVKSMKAYGYLQAYPMLCKRDGGKLVIVDGQHRFMIAQELELPVSYVIEERDLDVAVINAGQRTWNIAAYVNRFIAKGLGEYAKLREFAELHGMPLGMAAGVLIGNNTAANAHDAIKAGTFKVTDWRFASMVARVFTAVRHAAKECATAQTLNAISAICTIGDVDVDRLCKNIERRADMLRRFNNRDACLDMFEAIYNDQAHAKYRRPLAFDARNVLAERRWVGAKGQKKGASDAATKA